MTDTTPDPGPEFSDDPWHIQWLRAQRDVVVGDTVSPTPSEEAAAAANGLASPVAPVPPVLPVGPGRGRRRTFGLALLALIAVGGLVIGLVRSRSGGKDATSEPSSATAPTPATTTGSSSAESSPTTVPTSRAVATTVTVTIAVTTPSTSVTTAAPTTAAPTTSAAPTTTRAPAANVLDATPTERLPGGQLWPRGLYVFPKFLMQGTVPSQQVADAIGAKIGAIIGTENIVDELVKDPTVPLVKTVIVRIGPSIIFDTDSDVIRAESVEGWNQWGLFLKANPAVTVTIIGHTDSRGTVEHNTDLAKRRAESAKARMVEVGVDPSRIVTVGKGADDPVADNSTSAGMQQNRRIEVAVNNALG